MYIYELYNVPNDKLDGTEEYIDYATTMESANIIFEEMIQRFTNVWLIQVNEG